MSEDMFGFYMKGQSLFEGLEETHVQKLQAAAKQHVLKKNNRLVINSLVSNRVYFLVKGKLKIESGIEANNRSVKDILYPGEMFGNVSLNGFRGEEHAEALVNNTVVYCFAANDFFELIKFSHKLALNYANSISRKLFVLNERYEIWTRRDTRTRFIYLLRKWAAAEGLVTDQNILLNNYLSLSDIADILSVSRQFLHRLVKEMSDDGMLKYNRKHIEVSKLLLQQISKN